MTPLSSTILCLALSAEIFLGGGVDTVLCVGADGHTEIEAVGASCCGIGAIGGPDAESAARRSHGTTLSLAGGTSDCEGCVDIPMGRTEFSRPCHRAGSTFGDVGLHPGHFGRAQPGSSVLVDVRDTESRRAFVAGVGDLSVHPLLSTVLLI